jgi:hypothetical protein
MKKPENQIELLNDTMALLENRSRKDYEELKLQFYETSGNFRPTSIYKQAVKDFRELFAVKVKTNLFKTLLSITRSILKRNNRR